MLREHLLQQHDRASRRFERIDRHVSWLHGSVLGGRPARVLDLGCGPGFYTSRLARLGHDCVGIDFSPASIDHARSEAEGEGLACEYRLQDLASSDFGDGYDAALLVFGELNTFAPSDARSILGEARRALVPGGVLVLEVHEEAFVRAMGAGAPTWFTAQQGVFSDEPHLCLRECCWHPMQRAATERHFMVPLSGAALRVYTSTTQAYSDDEYLDVLVGSGFTKVERYDSLTGDAEGIEPGLFVLVARK
ncbi:MAG: class I SAM-dependent methyltransferase [bacterium]|nr:class I SAM-dependent methyltransferase [bacterium]